MLKITITIDTNNAAFQDRNKEQEIHTILAQATFKYERGYEDIVLKDSNGNSVGKLIVEEIADEEL